MRKYRDFSWKDTNLRICSDHFDLITGTIVKQRKLLERYINTHPQFQSSLKPIALKPQAPEIAQKMAKAAELTGLGPMASVAGTLAQKGVEAAIAAGSRESIVENGGDMYILSQETIIIGIYTGTTPLGNRLAFRLTKEELPLAICSSSSHMGHSLSLGQCDLATVIGKDAALADSVATMVCNRISSIQDVEKVLNDAGTIPGIQGILAIKNKHIGIWGDLPELVRNLDETTVAKVTRDKESHF